MLHPFLIAAYPTLFLLSYNITQIPIVQAIRPLLVSLSVAILLTVLFGIAANDFRQGGLSVSIILMLFFTYGQVYHWLEENTPIFANHLLLGSIWLLLLLTGLALKWKIQEIGNITKYLNIIMIGLLIQPVFNIAFFVSRSGVPENIIPSSPFEHIKPNPQANKEFPDIYYIILDGYDRSDVAQEVFGFDNSFFIKYLTERGFYVAKQSHSNYIQTSLSISSSLNLDYLGGTEGQPAQSGDRDPLAELIHHSKLRNFLEEKGYHTVTFDTGYAPTNITDSDVFIPYKANLINDLEGLLLTTSALRAMGDRTQNLFIPFLCDVHRGGINNILENLKKVPELPGPKFVFAHISSPHPPFVFDENGGAAKLGSCNGLDGSLFKGTFEDYHKGYPQQMAYISKKVQEAVDEILAKSKPPPVIIIQGDHGSGMLLDWELSKNSCLRERTSILNAYYIPKTNDLYESITPVNSFRVVLNEVFDLQLPLLEDRSYYSPWDKPYQLENIAQKVETRCKIPEQ